MDMRKILFCLALLLGSGLAMRAQDAAQGLQEIRFGVGVRGPVDRSVGWGSPEIVSLSYAHYGQRGYGIRTGIEFMPQNTRIDTYFGIPVALSARTRAYSLKESIGHGITSAAAGAVRDAYYGIEPTAKSLISDFLLNLFNRAEFFAGLTPGYIAGESRSVGSSYGNYTQTDDYINLNHHFSLTADVGFSLSFRIWRFNIGVVPAVHYYLTNNFTSISDTYPVSEEVGGNHSHTETPVRFHFSALGALSFSF